MKTLKRSGASVREALRESNRGAGPATSVLPDFLVTLPRKPDDEPQERFASIDGAIEDEGAERHIEETFRRKLSALRRLPPCERAAALRRARDDRDLDLRCLRDRRHRARIAQRKLRRERAPEPV